VIIAKAEENPEQCQAKLPRFLYGYANRGSFQENSPRLPMPSKTHASPKRVALLFNANKVYDRQVISGVGLYLASTRVEWDLFIEEDFRSRAHKMLSWEGDGVIADYDDPEITAALSTLAIPVVAVGGSYTDASQYPPDVPYVATDNFKLVRLAYDHLIEQGLPRFAFYGLPPEPGNRWAREREDAFLHMVKADHQDCPVYRGSPASAAGWRRSQNEMVEWVHSLAKPVGIVCVTDARARQLLQACIIGDVAVPEQVAIVGIDNEPMVQLLGRIPLTSVIQGAEEMGRIAARILHRMLQGFHCTSERILVPPSGINAQASSQFQAIGSAYVMRARHYLRQYAHLGIKSEQVAHYVGVSRTVLDEHFRRELKQTVHHAILEQKLHIARTLLADASIPLADVAIRSGFTSLQYMHTVFRREFKCTPREMQKTLHDSIVQSPEIGAY
jgi:LacI family transcriptional regulator, galactose operon repressor